jgi:hypothetical protein
VADLFDGYQLAEAWDEMFAAPGKPRPLYARVLDVLQPMDPAELRFRADQLARVFTDRGVTYDFAGEERPTRQRPGRNRRSHPPSLTARAFQRLPPFPDRAAPPASRTLILKKCSQICQGSLSVRYTVRTG